MSRNGTPMQRLRDRGRKALSPERSAAVQERRLEMQAEGAAETVLGNRPFEVVNVEGTDVAPFLGKTDGEKLVEASGLDDGVVETPAIAVEAVTSADFDYVTGVIDGKTTSPVVLATKSVTVLDGESVDLLGNCSIASVGSSTGASVTAIGRIYIYRDGSPLASSERYGGVVIRGVAYGLSATTAVTDEPAAGTYVYTFVSVLDTISDVSTFELSNRYLRATRRKR